MQSHLAQFLSVLFRSVLSQCITVMTMKTVWDRDGINHYNVDTKEIPMDQLPFVFIPSVEGISIHFSRIRIISSGVRQSLARRHGNCKKTKA